MIEALLVVLIISVIVLAVVVFRALRSNEDPAASLIEQQMTDMMNTQQSLVGKVDTVSTQQVESSRQLTESFGKSQKELSQSLADRLGKVEAEMNKNLATSSKETAESLDAVRLGRFVNVLALDVLEHIEDDVAALSNLVGLLDGGALVPSRAQSPKKVGT